MRWESKYRVDTFSEMQLFWIQPLVYSHLESEEGMGGGIKMLSHEEAIEKFKEAVKEMPENAEIWCSWGVALTALQQFEEAVEKFAEAVKHRPDFAIAWYGCGLALMALGRKEEAAERIKKAIEIAPDLAKEWSGPECLV
jgi:tetratricopeptide (TPR) repeat protein